MDTWFVPFTKEIGLPAMVAITFIWYFVRVFFPEQKDMMLSAINSSVETVKTLGVQHEQNLIRLQEFNEKMLREVIAHNLHVHDVLNKRIDGVVSEIIEFKEEISRRLEFRKP